MRPVMTVHTSLFSNDEYKTIFVPRIFEAEKRRKEKGRWLAVLSRTDSYVIARLNNNLLLRNQLKR